MLLHYSVVYSGDVVMQLLETFSRLKIREKIFSIFGAIIVLYILNMLVSSYNIGRIKDNVDSIYQNRLLSISALLEADRDAYQSRIQIAEAIAEETANGVAYQNMIGQRIEVLNENLIQIGQRFQKFESLYLSTGGQRTRQFDLFKRAYDNVVEHSAAIESQLRDGRIASARQRYQSRYATDFDTMRTAMDKLTELSYEQTALEYQASIKQTQTITLLSYVFFALMLGFLFVAGTFLAKNIMQTLGVEPQEAALIANNLAQGNVGFELHKPTAVGLYKDMKQMVSNLGRIIGETLQVSDNLAATSRQFSAASNQISQGANTQAASTEAVASSMRQMTAAIEENANSAVQTHDISAQAVEDIASAQAAAKRTVDSMEKIAEKTAIIGEIAKQTNILALNAAVEAVRAGESGKGFAIIAAEVRNLAENSQKAAVEIDQLSASSVAVATESDKLLSTVVPSIQQTSALVDVIAIGSKQQTESSRDVTRAIQQLNQIVQQNAAAAEQMASSSQALDAQSAQLKQTMAFFRR